MEKNIMPEIHIGVSDVARAALDGIKSVLRPLPASAPLHMSNHYLKEHFEPTDGEAIEGYAEIADVLREPRLPLTDGWDSLGNYIDKSEYEG